MNTEDPAPQRFRLLPFQVVEIDGGFLIRRGAEQFTIIGEGTADFLQLIGKVITAGSFSLEELTGRFAGPDRDKVMFVIRELASRGMVVGFDDPIPVPERGEDVFFWNHGTTTADVGIELGRLDIALVGMGEIALAVSRCLVLAGVRRITVIDDPLLRTMACYKDEIFRGRWPGELDVRVISPEAWYDMSATSNRILVGCSDFGARQLMLPWNEACVEQGIRFLPVLLKDLTGWVGPFVIPGETACHACASTRLNMHLDQYESAVERAMARDQRAVASHPLMAAMLADLAVMRLVMQAGGFATADPDAILEIDFTTLQCRSRRVLKIPRCPVCSSTNRYPETDPYPLQPLPA